MEIVNVYEPVAPEFWEYLEKKRIEILARWILRAMREIRKENKDARIATGV